MFNEFMKGNNLKYKAPQKMSFKASAAHAPEWWSKENNIKIFNRFKMLRNNAKYRMVAEKYQLISEMTIGTWQQGKISGHEAWLRCLSIKTSCL